MNNVILILPPASPDLNRDGYPDNWEEIATALKNWAEWKCENCFHEHDPKTGYCLTVHHLDGDKLNCTFQNLLACCQRCHLHIQATFKPGQVWMFARPFWAFIRGL